MKWKLCSPGKIYAPGEKVCVYFDAGSGDTHLIGETAGAVLGMLTKAPLTLDEIAARLQHGAPEAAEHRLQIQDMLHELSAVDLVETV